MTILVKIKEGRNIYDKIKSDLIAVGKISEFNISGENYILMTPVQAKALQKLGAVLETYTSNRTLYSAIPIVPEGTKVEKINYTPTAAGPEFDSFVKDLEAKLA